MDGKAATGGERDREHLLEQIDELRARLEEAEQTLKPPSGAAMSMRW